MKKLAVFVEGQTEQLVVENLLIQIAGKHNIRIDKVQATGGEAKRKYIEIDGKSVDSGEEFYALVVDCRGDESVKSDILNRYAGLSAEGFALVIGIRDVFPLQRADLPKLRLRLYQYVKTKPLRVVLVLAVMEVEAWFLAECTHFPRIHAALTTDLIRDNVGFDPCVDDVELRDHPANDLHVIYRLAGMSYNKRRANALRTIEALDWASFYFALPDRVPSLRTLTDAIDSFLVPDTEAGS
jgi:hypothetical protein